MGKLDNTNTRRIFRDPMHPNTYTNNPPMFEARLAWFVCPLGLGIDSTD